MQLEVRLILSQVQWLVSLPFKYQTRLEEVGLLTLLGNATTTVRLWLTRRLELPNLDICPDRFHRDNDDLQVHVRVLIVVLAKVLAQY